MATAKFIYDAKLDSTMQYYYVDVDEMRERVLPDGRTLPYRYVHGGIREHNLKFIFCFPPKEEFQGRFFQYLSPFPGPDEEVAFLDKTGEDDKIAFCLLHGAYYVESNMGSAAAFGESADETIRYKTSAAAAECSRKEAMKYYGTYVSKITHVYETPGTYYASVRVKEQRDGDGDDIFTQIKNIARARVVVE